MPRHGASRLDAELLVLTLAAIAAACVQQPLPGGGPPWLDRALREGDWLIEGAAALTAASGLGRVQAARLVRRHTGQTPTALVARLRCEEAARRLRRGEGPIPSVATACGFGDLAHFYRCFRRIIGCTPAACRAAEDA